MHIRVFVLLRRHLQEMRATAMTSEIAPQWENEAKLLRICERKKTSMRSRDLALLHFCLHQKERKHIDMQPTGVTISNLNTNTKNLQEYSSDLRTAFVVDASILGQPTKDTDPIIDFLQRQVQLILASDPSRQCLLMIATKAQQRAAPYEYMFTLTA